MVAFDRSEAKKLGGEFFGPVEDLLTRLPSVCACDNFNADTPALPMKDYF
jgi:hypothetical protein